LTAPALEDVLKIAYQIPLPWQLAWRYLRGERSQLLGSTARAALLANTLGVTAMVVAMALMTGYTQDLKRKLIGLQAEIVASPLTGLEPDAEIVAQAAALPGVVRASRVAYGEGSISSPALPDGVAVTLRGVEPAVEGGTSVSGGAAGALSTHDLESLAAEDGDLPRVLLGKELARRLEVAEGDPLRLVVLGFGERRPRFRYRSVEVAGTFSSGFAEFDARWVLLDRGVLEKLRGERGFDLVEFKLADPAETSEIAPRIEEILGPDYTVSDWQRLNRELFTALGLQELVLFLVLGLIVVVSTFNVASTLVILVRERMRDIGVLGALGLSPGELWGLFVAYGLFLGAAGTLLGVLVGSAISWVLTTFELVSFGPEVAAIYFIDSVPFRVELMDVAAIVAFSLTVTFAACALPALRAARLRPSAALRYE